MLTDIDKLHAAINDTNTWMDRGTGKTTIIIHQLAGQIQLGNYDYIGLVINFSHEFGYLWPMIHSIFEEQRIKILELHYDNHSRLSVPAIK
jgi:hypothetical protein